MADIRIKTTPRMLAALPTVSSPAELNNRGTGRSTTLALKAIAKAMDNEGAWVMPLDHHGTRDADRHLVRRCQDIVGMLGLSGFTFRDNILSYKYTIEVTIHG